MSEQQKLSLTSAAMKGRCPKCHQGRMFPYPFYSLKFAEMRDNCEACGLKYEVEPGFFWGSMYISYAISVAIAIIVGVGTFLITGEFAPVLYSILIFGFIALFSPFIFRASRVIMIYLFSFVKYDENAIQKYQNSKKSKEKEA